MWLRWVHHFIVYCYNQIATRSNLRGELFWVTLKGWNLPWQGRNGCGSKRQLVTCMHIQNEGKGPLVFSFSLSPPSGTLAHVVMLPTFLSQGIPKTQLWKHPHGHVYCGASGTPQACLSLIKLAKPKIKQADAHQIISRDFYTLQKYVIQQGCHPPLGKTKAGQEKLLSFKFQRVHSTADYLPHLCRDFVWL